MSEPTPSLTKKASDSKIPALDGVRGIAILSVMVSHFIVHDLWKTREWYGVMQGGWLGVDLFFVLSGFLITGILLRTRERPHYFSDFYQRRVLRIFPLYFFAIFLVWACVVFIERAPERLHGYDSWWWYVFCSSNIAMGLKDNWTYHSHFLDANHLWSIAVEEQFYLIWPLLVWLLPARWLAIGCLLVVHFSTTWRYMTDAWVGHEWSIAAYVFPYCRMEGLAIGSFLGICWHYGWQKRIPYIHWLAAGGMIWMGIRVFQGLRDGHTQFFNTIASVLFGCLLILALDENPKNPIRRICEQPFLRHLGVYSYGLYVFHNLPHPMWFGAFGWLLDGQIPLLLGQIIYILLCFAVTYGLARVSWILVEKPFMDRKNKMHH